MPHPTPLVAVSGLGSIGYQHVRAFSTIPGVELAVFDPSETLVERARELPTVRTVAASFEDLLSLRPQAVVLAGPDHAHLPQLSAAVAAGIPTLVEKPLAPSAADARRIATEISATDVPVLVGYVLRHRLVMHHLHRLLVDGAVGRPTTVQVVVGAYHTITAAASRFAVPEENRLYRDYSHEWDYLRWFFGPIDDCFAVARVDESVEHVERPNIVDALIRTASGLVASCHIDYVATPGLRTVHVIGSRGSIFADVASGTLTLRRADDGHAELYSFPEPPGGPLRRQAEHLLDVADGTVPPAVDFADGLAALDVVDALITSAQDGEWKTVPRDGSDVPPHPTRDPVSDGC